MKYFIQTLTFLFKESFKLVLYPILLIIALFIFNFIFFIHKIPDASWTAIIVQFLLFALMPVALTIIFANRQYLKAILLVYGKFSTVFQEKITSYLKSEEFKKTSSERKGFVLANNAMVMFDSYVKSIDSKFLKNIIALIVAQIPFAKLYDKAMQDNLTLDESEAFARKMELIPTYFFKSVDEYVNNFFDTNKHTVIITIMILADIITSIFLI